MQTDRPLREDPRKEDPEMFQSLYHVVAGRFVVLRDGSISGFSQPEPRFLQRRYEQAEALRQMRRESRIQEALASESAGFVERIRGALGIA